MKSEFQDSDVLTRQCVVSFDEMSIDSNFVYDYKDDKVLGLKSNMLVVFARGLFSPLKTAIYYEFDEKLNGESLKSVRNDNNS